MLCETADWNLFNAVPVLQSVSLAAMRGEASCPCCSLHTIPCQSLAFFPCGMLQVFERLKACSAYIQLAQGFTKSTKTAEQKVAKAAAKLNKLQSLKDLQIVATAAAEPVELSHQNSAAAAQV